MMKIKHYPVWKRLNSKKDTKAENGFTLIELAVVLVVVSILAVVTIPKYQRFVEHYQLESSSQKVIATIRYARQLAIKERSSNNEYIGFLNDGMQILFGQGSSGLELVGSKVSFETGVTLDSIISVPNNIHLIDVNNVTYTGGISYQWEGFLGTNSGLTDTDVVVTLQGSLGDKVVLTISAATGDITVSWP